MVDAPERIWVWPPLIDEMGSAVNTIQQPEHVEYVRADVAELAAENERLKQAIADANADRDRWYESSFRANSRTEALASTVAVKALPRPDTVSMSGGAICLEYADYDLRDAAYDWLEAHGAGGELEPHPRDTNTVDAHETANVSDKPTTSKMEAVEPTQPKGQQEPVAWALMSKTAGALSTTIEKAVATKWKEQEALSGFYLAPLFTRPPEQAVTEAAGPFITFANHAVEKTDDGWVWRTSSNERICDWFGPSDFGSLKAAMEAGG